MTDLSADFKALASYRPTNKVRFVTAASLFDGHDAAINIMRRILQGMGAEVIHLGHNRSVDDVVTAALQSYDVRYGKADDLITSLSGGNQQKVLVARAYLGAPALVVLDEPTRGIDVGARLRIYDDIRARAAAGVPSIVISNDAEEIAAIADRALIMRRGAIVDEITKPTRENVYAATVS